MDPLVSAQPVEAQSNTIDNQQGGTTSSSSIANSTKPWFLEYEWRAIGIASIIYLLLAKDWTIIGCLFGAIAYTFLKRGSGKKDLWLYMTILFCINLVVSFFDKKTLADTLSYGVARGYFGLLGSSLIYAAVGTLVAWLFLLIKNRFKKMNNSVTNQTQTNIIDNPQPVPTQSSTPLVKPWSSLSMIGISILFGPGAGLLLVWQNLKRLGRNDLANKFLPFGIVALFVVVLSSFFIPIKIIDSSARSFITYFLAALFPLYHEITYLRKWNKEHPKATGSSNSWSMLGWGFLGLVIYLILALVIAMFIPDSKNTFPLNNTQQTNKKSAEVLKTFSDTKIGITFQYSSELQLNGKYSDTTMRLNGGVEKIEEIPEDITFRWDKNTAKKDESQLEKGVFGEEIGAPLKESEKVIKIGNTYAKTFTEIGQVVDVCGSVYTRNLILYKNGYRFYITLIIPEKLLISSIPEYFTVDQGNCGDGKIFDHTKKLALYRALEQKEMVGSVAQKWFDSFDDIVGTIKLSSEDTSLSTYRNEKYNFQFSYPVGSVVKEEGNKITVGSITYMLYDANVSDKNDLLSWWTKNVKTDINGGSVPNDYDSSLNKVPFSGCIIEKFPSWQLPPALWLIYNPKTTTPFIGASSNSTYLFYDFGKPFILNVAETSTGACVSDDYFPIATIVKLK